MPKVDMLRHINKKIMLKIKELTLQIKHDLSIYQQAINKKLLYRG